MELFYGMELPQHVVDCMLGTDKAQFGFHKDTTQTLHEIVERVQERCLDGEIYLVYDNDICLFFTDQSPYTLHMDSIRGPRGSIFEYTKLIKKVVQMFKEKTLIHKLETRTPFTDLEILAKRCKWDHEGTHKESYQMPDGSFADEYTFGLVLTRTEEQRKAAEENMDKNLGLVMEGER